MICGWCAAWGKESRARRTQPASLLAIVLAEGASETGFSRILTITRPDNIWSLEVRQVETSQFFTVEQFAGKYPAFTPSSLRWLLFNRATNGLDAAVVQLGRRVLIDEAAFVAWLRDHRHPDRREVDEPVGRVSAMHTTQRGSLVEVDDPCNRLAERLPNARRAVGSAYIAMCPICWKADKRVVFGPDNDLSAILEPQCGCAPAAVLKAISYDEDDLKFRKPASLIPSEPRQDPIASSQSPSIGATKQSESAARNARDNAHKAAEDISQPRAPAADSAKKNAFVFRSASELLAEPTPYQWLVRTLFELATLVLFYGDAASGKTWLALSIGVHVAAALQWFGCDVTRGAVFVIAGEGNRGLRRRLKGFLKHHGIDAEGLPLFFSDGAAALTDNFSVADVITEVQRLVTETGHRPVLVIVDTLARNFGDADENSTKDMGAFVHGCDWVRNEFACTVLVLHHVGHQDKTRARGSTTLRGALDAEYRIIMDEAGTIDMTCTKAKDFEAPPPRRFTLTKVELDWLDDDGNPVTSAAIVTTDAQPVTRGKRGRGKNQTIAMKVLEAAYERHRSNLLNANRDPAAAVVALLEWRDLCIEAGIPRQRFAEVVQSLQDVGHVRIEHGYVHPGMPYE